MSIKEQIEADLKQAMLSGNKVLVETLRTVKAAILTVEVAEGKRDVGLNDKEAIAVLSKEAKKRQESADMYSSAESTDRADKELQEKSVIEQYLPAQLTEDEIAKLVDQAITEVGEVGPQAMGQVIGKVKQLSAGAADGSVIARIVKEKLS